MSKLSTTVLLSLAAGLAVATPASAAQVRFTYDVRGDVSIPVPLGVTSLDVRLSGAPGRDGESVAGEAGNGGQGALVSGRLDVTPGTPLVFRVDGGAARAATGQQGGAGGHMAALLVGDTYLVAAAGGGGGGGGVDGGDGGNAGVAGAGGTSLQENAGGGGAGSATFGGAGGVLSTGGAAGAAGVANAGGVGGAAPTLTSGAGGGGGGGIFGGGGGGSTSGPTKGSGGGGGGASFADPQRMHDVTQGISPDEEASIKITYNDATAPQPTLAPMTYNPSALTGTAGTDFGDATTVKLKLSSGQTLTATVRSDGTYSVAVPSLADGSYSVTASQNDVVDNTGTTAGTFIVDTTAPTIDTGSVRATYTRGELATTGFTCADANAVAACDGPATVDTTSLGDKQLKFTARDAAGNERTKTVDYTVTAPPLVLDISLGEAPRFASFLVGQARDYTATGTATVTSTAQAATFSVVDSTTNHPGHLVNGTYALASPLQIRATSAAGTSTGAGALSGTPRTLLDYARPVGADAVTLSFTQHIGAGDLLRTGNYAKTLTYTLATTTP
ncbi:Ig-like domain-containing protein [Solirubrobacter phytolaccae]|uniref:Ig-like domain-containing protein n=1 Tax=Solirubrobacter phytolaccae TaxID=1404360 RepID=A0A9X3N934_9ACTN|nr:Ig-like domain-containing protein [Solirubrobacter phytolaccae]MDA0179861.1 Ig-like domain-containing protein [Solirubrobacter phytolaccae]